MTANIGTGYLEGDDATATLGMNDLAGQTFKVYEEQEPRLLILTLKKPQTHARVQVRLFKTDASHHPTGDCLHTSWVDWDDFSPYKDDETITVGFHPSAPLEANIEYVILLNQIHLIFPSAGWHYDSTSATYPRGMRIFSGNGGSTWTDYPSQDHMFYLWGSPPAPPPPPPTQPNKWAITNIIQTVIQNGWSIEVQTDRPCHLWLYWTDKEPWTHRKGGKPRGLKDLWDSYWCFVAWQDIEQAENGDSITHTFTWTDWEFCQTRWFRFKGTIGGKDCVSDSPIFKKHYTGFTPFIDQPWTTLDEWEYKALPPGPTIWKEVSSPYHLTPPTSLKMWPPHEFIWDYAAIPLHPKAQDMKQGQIITSHLAPVSYGKALYIYWGIQLDYTYTFRLAIAGTYGYWSRWRITWWQITNQYKEPKTQIMTERWVTDHWGTPTLWQQNPLFGNNNRVGLGGRLQIGYFWRIDDTQILS